MTPVVGFCLGRYADPSRISSLRVCRMIFRGQSKPVERCRLPKDVTWRAGCHRLLWRQNRFDGTALVAVLEERIERRKTIQLLESRFSAQGTLNEDGLVSDKGSLLCAWGLVGSKRRQE